MLSYKEFLNEGLFGPSKDELKKSALEVSTEINKLKSYVDTKHNEYVKSVEKTNESTFQAAAAMTAKNSQSNKETEYTKLRNDVESKFSKSGSKIINLVSAGLKMIDNYKSYIYMNFIGTNSKNQDRINDAKKFNDLYTKYKNDYEEELNNLTK